MSVATCAREIRKLRSRLVIPAVGQAILAPRSVVDGLRVFGIKETCDIEVDPEIVAVADDREVRRGRRKSVHAGELADEGVAFPPCAAPVVVVSHLGTVFVGRCAAD